MGAEVSAMTIKTNTFLLALVSFGGLFTFPAQADVQLSLKGVYGDHAGCQNAKNIPVQREGGVFLSSRLYAGYEWSCKFAWVHEENGDTMGAYSGSTVWSVITLCASEGEAYSSLLSIQRYGDEVAIRNGTNEPVVLNRCK